MSRCRGMIGLFPLICSWLTAVFIVGELQCLSVHDCCCQELWVHCPRYPMRAAKSAQSGPSSSVHFLKRWCLCIISICSFLSLQLLLLWITCLIQKHVGRNGTDMLVVVTVQLTCTKASTELNVTHTHMLINLRETQHVSKLFGQSNSLGGHSRVVHLAWK